MQFRMEKLSWRIAAGGLMSLALLAVTSLSVVGAQPSNSNRATSQPIQSAASGKGSPVAIGKADLSKAPTVNTKGVSGRNFPHLDRRTKEQRAAYESSLKRATNLPSAT